VSVILDKTRVVLNRISPLEMTTTGRNRHLWHLCWKVYNYAT